MKQLNLKICVVKCLQNNVLNKNVANNACSLLNA